MNHHIFLQGEDQWQEVTGDESNNDIPQGAVVKGPTMPTQADLQQVVTETKESIPSYSN